MERWEYQPDMTAKDKRRIDGVENWVIPAMVMPLCLLVIWGAAFLFWANGEKMAGILIMACIVSGVCLYVFGKLVLRPLTGRRKLRKAGRAFKFPAGEARDDYDKLMERIESGVPPHRRINLRRTVFHAYKAQVEKTWGWQNMVLQAKAEVDLYDEGPLPAPPE